MITLSIILSSLSGTDYVNLEILKALFQNIRTLHNSSIVSENQFPKGRIRWVLYGYYLIYCGDRYYSIY